MVRASPEKLETDLLDSKKCFTIIFQLCQLDKSVFGLTKLRNELLDLEKF